MKLFDLDRVVSALIQLQLSFVLLSRKNIVLTYGDQVS